PLWSRPTRVGYNPPHAAGARPHAATAPGQPHAAARLRDGRRDRPPAGRPPRLSVAQLDGTRRLPRAGARRCRDRVYALALGLPAAPGAHLAGPDHPPGVRLAPRLRRAL